MYTGPNLLPHIQIGKLYSNPVYQMELARRQRESQNLSTLVAASSSDDITLVSKVPIHKPVSTLATTTMPPGNYHSYSKSVDENDETNRKVPVSDAKKPPEEKRLEHLKRLQPLSRSQEFNVQAAKAVNKIPSTTVEPMSSGVHVLRMQYEPPTPPHVPPTAHAPPTLSPLHPHIPPTRTAPSLQPNGKSGRCNSVGNSDSGRESMILETDV